MSKQAPNWLEKLEKYMPGPESKYSESPMGFWVGVLHGIIVPLTFIYSFYQARVSLIAKDNIDSGYNFGYLLGIVALLKAIIGN